MAHTENTPESWLGTWAYTNPDTRATMQLVITNNEQRLLIGFGECHPRGCDWGTSDLHICKSQTPTVGTVGFASWDTKFKVTYIVLRLEDEQLAVESFHIYKNDSVQKDRTSNEVFRKH